MFEVDFERLSFDAHPTDLDSPRNRGCLFVWITAPDLCKQGQGSEIQNQHTTQPQTQLELPTKSATLKLSLEFAVVDFTKRG